MNASEFSEALSRAAPTVEYLMQCGFSMPSAQDCHETYFLKVQPCGGPRFQDPVEELICQYDTGKMEFGLVVLDRRAKVPDVPAGKLVVGHLEADPLAINTSTGTIELLDHENTTFVMATIARSGSHLLEALLLLASFREPCPGLPDRLSRKQREQNKTAACERARQCSEASGADGEPIFRMLLGCD